MLTPDNDAICSFVTDGTYHYSLDCNYTATKSNELLTQYESEIRQVVQKRFCCETIVSWADRSNDLIKFAKIIDKQSQ